MYGIQLLTNINYIVKNQILVKNRKFWSKIKIMAQNRNVCQMSKFWSKMEIMAKNRKFCQISKFWSRIEILTKIPSFIRYKLLACGVMGRQQNVTTFSSVDRFIIRKKLLCDIFFVDFEKKNFSRSLDPWAIWGKYGFP